jgi:hypothetical protein
MWGEREGVLAMSSRVVVCLCTVITLVTLAGAPGFLPSPVLAASGKLTLDTPLHDSPDPAAPVIALLAEGTIVSIDGPPVAGFYPVTAGELSGWMRGETLSVEKDTAESVAVEELDADPLMNSTDETVPAEAPTELDPTADPSAATEASPPVDDSALGADVVPTTEPVAAELVPADTMDSVNEPAPVGTVSSAPELASASDATPVPTVPDGVAAPLESATTTSEVAAEPTIDPNVTPIPVAEVAPVGPASVTVEAPILAGPGPEYGLMATASAGSTVEKTGHVIDGYVTVQYAEVTGWVALDLLGAPSTRVDEPPLAESTPPIEAPPADAPPAELPPTELAPTEARLAENPTPEISTVETPTADTSPADMTPIESSPVDMVPIEAAPVNAPPEEVAPVAAP